MPGVAITGWSKGFSASLCIQLLRSSVGLSSPDAGRVTEGVLAGKEQEVRARSDADAQLLVTALQKIGAAAHVKP